MAKAFNSADGLRWFGEGVRALKNRPLGLVGIVVFYVLVSGLLSGLPIVGTILAGVWMPFGAVLTGFAAREALADRLPVYAPLLAAFKKSGMRLHLIAVGLISAGVLEIVMLVFQLLSADQIAQWKIVDGAIDPESVAAHFPAAGVAAALVLYAPLFMATLFAPLLIADAGQSVGKSFFYSFFGILKNFSACFTTGLLLMLLTSAAVFLALGAGLAAGLGGAATYVTPLIAILISTVAQACVWPMYRDLFGPRNLFERLN